MPAEAGRRRPRCSPRRRRTRRGRRRGGAAEAAASTRVVESRGTGRGAEANRQGGSGREGRRRVEPDVAASQVKELRETTGAGMMDCKRALEETGGDIEAAQKLLREKGVAQAGKRAGGARTEGIVGSHGSRAQTARSSRSAARRSRSRRTRSSVRSRRRCSRPCTRTGPTPSSRSSRSASTLGAKLGREHRRRRRRALRDRRGRGRQRLRAPAGEQDRRHRQARGRQRGAGAPAGDAHLVRGARVARARTTFRPRRSRPSGRST